MTDQNVTILEGLGVRTEDDLQWTEFEEYLNKISVVMRRKLDTVSRFLATGNELDATSTLNTIQLTLNPPALPVGVPGPAPLPPLGLDLVRGAPKVYTDPLPDFSGEVTNYEDWERKAGVTIKQTGYKAYLDRPLIIGDVVEEACSKELYNMILSCVTGEHALNTIEKVRDNNNGKECGYLAWKSLKDWYRDPTQIDSMIHFWERKLNSVTLDVDTSATEYINNFEMYIQKLTNLRENWTDDKMVREFKKGVDDPDYDTEVRVHKGTFDKLIETVRKREQDLDRAADHQSRKNKRTRRVKFEVGSDDEYKTPAQGIAPLVNQLPTSRLCRSSYSHHLMRTRRRI